MPLLGSMDDDGYGAGDAGQPVETGTTTVGVATDDAVVLAADTQATGGIISNQYSDKVLPIDEGAEAVITKTGLVADGQQFYDTLRSEARTYATERGKEMSTETFATRAANIFSHYADFGRPRHLRLLVGGVDERDGQAQPRLYKLGSFGSKMAGKGEDPFPIAATGSGSPVAYGALEGGYEEDMSVDDAQDLAFTALEAAKERDTYTGFGTDMATITLDDGIDLRQFRPPELEWDDMVEHSPDG